MTQAIPNLCDTWFYLPFLFLIASKQKEGKINKVFIFFMLSFMFLYLPLCGVNIFYYIFSQLDKVCQATSIHKRACNMECQVT